jgi:methionine synthase II (cobalamin-independent)
MLANAWYAIVDLQQAYADYDAGKITREELVKAQDKSAEDSIKRMEATGQELVTDGEQRASSFATYPITESASIYHPERWASADIELQYAWWNWSCGKHES